MRKPKVVLILVSMMCISVLSCNLYQYLALQMAGLQGQVNSLTHVANPIGLPTLDPNITPTLVPTTPIVATPTMEVSPTGEASQIIGLWSGTTQWLCDNSPPMETTMDFKSTGKVTIIFVWQGMDPVIREANWTLNAGEINISVEYGGEYDQMKGTVTGNTITGSFEEHNENFDCYGTWMVTR